MFEEELKRTIAHEEELKRTIVNEEDQKGTSVHEARLSKELSFSENDRNSTNSPEVSFIRLK